MKLQQTKITDSDNFTDEQAMYQAIAENGVQRNGRWLDGERREDRCTGADEGAFRNGDVWENVMLINLVGTLLEFATSNKLYEFLRLFEELSAMIPLHWHPSSAKASKIIWNRMLCLFCITLITSLLGWLEKDLSDNLEHHDTQDGTNFKLAQKSIVRLAQKRKLVQKSIIGLA